MNITLRQLQVFVAVSRCGSVSAAAQQIGLSQSAASMALADLERQLGATLFDRQGRRLLLNSFGEKQLTRADRILREAAELEAGAEQQAFNGSVGIAASLTIGNYLLPELVGGFWQKYPQVGLQIDLVNSQQVLLALRRMSAEVGLIEDDCAHEGYQRYFWRRDDLVVVARPGWLQQGQSTSVAELLQQPWILREAGSGTREVFENALGRAAAKLKVRLALSRAEAIKRCVRQGLGLSCLSRLAVADDVARGDLVIVPTPELELQRELSLLLWPQRYRTPEVEALVAYLLDSARAPVAPTSPNTRP